MTLASTCLYIVKDLLSLYIEQLLAKFAYSNEKSQLLTYFYSVSGIIKSL